MRDAQLLDSDSGPAPGRSSTFFYTDESIAAQERRVRRKNNSFSAFRLADATVLGIGLIALIELAPLLLSLGSMTTVY